MRPPNISLTPVSVAGLTKTGDRLWALDTAPHKIYVAASMPAQVKAMRLALELIDSGFLVTSRWLRKDFSDKPDQYERWHDYCNYEELWGEQDLEDLAAADTLVILADSPSSSGGYHVELGFFLGAGKTNVVVVGDRPNVFYWTRNVRFVIGTGGLVEWLQSPVHGSRLAPVEPVSVDAATVAKLDEDYPF